MDCVFDWYMRTMGGIALKVIVINRAIMRGDLDV